MRLTFESTIKVKYLLTQNLVKNAFIFVLSAVFTQLRVALIFRSWLLSQAARSLLLFVCNLKYLINQHSHTSSHSFTGFNCFLICLLSKKYIKRLHKAPWFLSPPEKAIKYLRTRLWLVFFSRLLDFFLIFRDETFMNEKETNGLKISVAYSHTQLVNREKPPKQLTHDPSISSAIVISWMNLNLALFSSDVIQNLLASSAIVADLWMNLSWQTMRQ